MRLTRRSLVSLAAVAPFAGAAPGRAAEDPRMGERSLGRPDAKLAVGEFFSLTCTHCAAFARETLPKVKIELIDSGKIRLVFRDFPLDQLGLTAAMVARSVAPERYEPFIMALFASQDRWAFARNINNFEEIWKLAALAGMNRATFDATVADDGLKTAILAAQDAAVKRWNINSTPSFVIKGEVYAGALSFERFNQVVTAALA